MSSTHGVAQMFALGLTVMGDKRWPTGEHASHLGLCVLSLRFSRNASYALWIATTKQWLSTEGMKYFKTIVPSTKTMNYKGIEHFAAENVSMIYQIFPNEENFSVHDFKPITCTAPGSTEVCRGEWSYYGYCQVMHHLGKNWAITMIGQVCIIERVYKTDMLDDHEHCIIYRHHVGHVRATSIVNGFNNT